MIRFRKFVIAALTTLVVSSTAAFAGPIGYAVDTSENLYTVDLSTAVTTLIGSTGQFLESLAYSAGGQLYGANTVGELFAINKLTGATTLIGDTLLGNIEGMHFNGSTLLASNFNSSATTIYSLDTSTAAATALVTTTPGEGVTRAMSIEVISPALLLTDSPSFQTLQAVDLTTGVTTSRGLVSSASGIYGIDFNGSTLYGLGGDGGLYIINASTGATTLLGNTGGQFWLDFVSAADVAEVPEPSSLVLFGLGALGLIARRRRQQTA